MKKITLSIPKPCHEKWSSFTPTAKGGFCSSCQKEVIDFSSWSDERILHHFSRASVACGRFRSDQLKTYESLYRKQSWRGILGAFVLTILGIFSQRPALAQKLGKPAVEQRLIDKTSSHGQDRMTLAGMVLDDMNTAIPGVNVVRKGTTEGTITDIHGRFTLTLDRLTENEQLVFSFIAMETLEIPIDRFRYAPVNLVLANDTTVVDLITVETLRMASVVAGGIGVKRVSVFQRFSPHRIWNSITNSVKSLLDKKYTCEPGVVRPQTVGEVEKITVNSETTERTPIVTCSPNPAVEKFTVYLPARPLERLLTLSSLQGQLIEERIAVGAEEYFNVSGLTSGVYILKVQSPEGVKWIRVVKK